MILLIRLTMANYHRDKLPSQREISQYYNVNRSTVIQSLDILKSYGILETIEKRRLCISI